MKLIAQPDVEGQLGADLEVVQSIEVIRPAVAVNFERRERPGCRSRDTQQEIRIGVARKAVREPDVAEKTVIGAIIIVFGTDQVESELHVVPAPEPAHMVLDFPGMGTVALLPPGKLVEPRDSVAEAHIQNAVDVRQTRGQADQPQLVHYVKTMLCRTQAEVVVNRIVVQAEPPTELVEQVRAERVRVRDGGGAVVALLPALPDGREIAFPGPVVQTRPGVPPENQIPVRNLVIDPRGPIRGRIVGPDLKLLVVLAVKVHKISG